MTDCIYDEDLTLSDPDDLDPWDADMQDMKHDGE